MLFKLGILQATMSTLILLGGTFDPFHLGHLYLAKQASADFKADVRILPSGNPPVASWQQRLTMCRLALAGDATIQVGEDDSPEAGGHMAITLDAIRHQHPDTMLWLVIGSDAYLSFCHWYKPEKILQRAHLLVAPRSSQTWPAALPATKKKSTNKKTLITGNNGIYLWHCQPPAISASACRAALSTGGDVNAMLPAAVAAYIAKNNLYRQ